MSVQMIDHPMTASNMSCRTIGILVADGFEEQDLLEARRVLEAAGAEVYNISPDIGATGRVRSESGGEGLPVDSPIESVAPSNFDGLVIPGGAESTASLHNDERALHLLHHFFDNGKPIAAVGQSISLLVDSGLANGRRIAGTGVAANVDSSVPPESRPQWVDEPVVADNGLVSGSERSGLIRSFMEAVNHTPLRPDHNNLWRVT